MLRKLALASLLAGACACNDGGPSGNGGSGGASSGGAGGASGTASGVSGGVGATTVTGGVGGAGGMITTTGGSGGASGEGRDAGAIDDAAIDGGDGDELVSPVPVDPCSEDLDAQPGVIAPSFGEARSGEAFSGDPNDDGAFDVLAVDATIGNPDASRQAIDATFYAPSTDGGATTAAGTHPLALVMHGFGVTHRAYEHFTQHLASHGIVVLGITMPFALEAAHDKNAAEAIAAIDAALGDAAPEAIRGHVDAERIAALGHSFGGKIAFYAASIDPRIDLVIGWDPSNAGGPPCFIDAAACNQFPVAPNCMADDSGMLHEMHAETVVLRAAADGANPEPAHNAIHFYRGAPAPATLIDFDINVAHGDFANATAPVLAHTRRVNAAFVLSRLLGTTGLEMYLPGGIAIDADPLVMKVQSR